MDLSLVNVINVQVLCKMNPYFPTIPNGSKKNDVLVKVESGIFLAVIEQIYKLRLKIPFEMRLKTQTRAVISPS